MGTITHASFTLGRTIQAPIGKVYAAFADKELKAKWFKGPESAAARHSLDFVVGGRESNESEFHGVTHRFEAMYYDIVPNERIVYAYEMYLDDRRISVSLATVEFRSSGNDSTDILLSEDGAYLDGADKPEMRQRGTEDLLSALANSVTN